MRQLGEGLEAHVMDMSLVSRPHDQARVARGTQQRVPGLSHRLRASASSPTLKAGPGLHSDNLRSGHVTLNRRCFALFLFRFDCNPTCLVQQSPQFSASRVHNITLETASHCIVTMHCRIDFI